MRIQHNIMAMNSYRNYTNNVSAMKKNLEKLSSGYKINRAGDDAAGLAISEKMRAQITGLKQAQQNAKSGINLVQTAEGALQEVHDMLNRMVKLADQSANGTYDDDVDRNQLQKEVSQLQEEINRIADSANFNGIKLLDGSMAGGAGAGKVELTGSKVGATLSDEGGAQEVDNISFAAGTLNAGDKVTVKVQYTDLNNQMVSKDYTFNAVSGGSLKYEDGSTAGANLGAAIQAALTKDGANATFTFGSASATALKATAVNKGSTAGQIIRMDVSVNGDPKDDAVSITRTTVGKDDMNGYSGFKAFNGADGEKAEDYVFTVNGAKFAFATKGNSGKFGSDVNVVTLATATVSADEAKEMMLTINRALGADVARVDGTKLKFLKGGGSGSGLTLQIGDTSESFNQLQVSIKDCHTSALGISGVDISTQNGAASAVQRIKDAINYVSDIRGTLGATQNRLDHTINNLSVMEENIQDAESTIRDTDVADEMMAYTKNNILIQSAQAMLAQANQVPQGVLQLLQ